VHSRPGAVHKSAIIYTLLSRFELVHPSVRLCVSLHCSVSSDGVSCLQMTGYPQKINQVYLHVCTVTTWFTTEQDKPLSQKSTWALLYHQLNLWQTTLDTSPADHAWPPRSYVTLEAVSSQDGSQYVQHVSPTDRQCQSIALVDTAAHHSHLVLTVPICGWTSVTVSWPTHLRSPTYMYTWY